MPVRVGAFAGRPLLFSRPSRALPSSERSIGSGRFLLTIRRSRLCKKFEMKAIVSLSQRLEPKPSLQRVYKSLLLLESP